MTFSVVSTVVVPEDIEGTRTSVHTTQILLLFPTKSPHTVSAPVVVRTLPIHVSDKTLKNDNPESKEHRQRV